MGRIVFFTAGIIFLSSFVHGQDSSIINSTLQWDLATTIAYAKQHNIQVNIQRLDQKLTEQDLSLSKAARFPNLSGSATQSLTHSSNTNPVVGGFQTQSKFAGNYSLNSSWSFYRGGYINYDIQSKQQQLQAANLNVSVTENEITLQITQAYLNILLAKESLVYVQDLVTTSKAQYEQGQIKYDAGSISKKDLLQLKAQAAGDEYNLVTAQNQYRQNILSLKQMLLLPTTTAFEPVVPDTLIVEKAIPSLLQAQNIALQNRPEIKYDQMQIDIAETELKKARTGYKPTLSVGGSISTGYSDNQSEQYFKQLNNNLFQRLGLTLAVPIFDNRIAKTNVERSKILIDEAKLTLDQTTTALNQQIEQAYLALSNSQGQYKAANVQLQANREAYNISLEQLKVGAISNVDLLVQRNLYIQSLQNYVQAKYNAILNMEIYEFYMGIPISL